jgi:hypothetical protein
MSEEPYAWAMRAAREVSQETCTRPDCSKHTGRLWLQAQAITVEFNKTKLVETAQRMVNEGDVHNTRCRTMDVATDSLKAAIARATEVEEDPPYKDLDDLADLDHELGK